jgi:hypothetical protein
MFKKKKEKTTDEDFQTFRHYYGTEEGKGDYGNTLKSYLYSKSADEQEYLGEYVDVIGEAEYSTQEFERLLEEANKNNRI